MIGKCIMSNFYFILWKMTDSYDFYIIKCGTKMKSFEIEKFTSNGGLINNKIVLSQSL
jgi:hypothetical protein